MGHPASQELRPPEKTEMVFSSLTFLLLLLPGILLVYYLVPRRARNAVALVASLFFYAWGAPRFVLVLITACAGNFVVGRMIDHPGASFLTGRAAGRHSKECRYGTRRGWLTAGVLVNVAVLVYFKYANFLVDELNLVLGAAGMSSVGWTAVALPIGISFFTFHEISYLVDVYRGVAPAARSFKDFLLYVTLFPQLIAGPIVRYHDVALQLRERDYKVERFYAGIIRFCVGLAKKVLVANVLAETADGVFAQSAATLGAGAAWIGILAYAFQLYFDFSGYSDMAIGLGRMLGFEFLENFNRPYVSASFTEFWRRWHISLSNFMREYVYVPLGGNRKGRIRTYWNLWLVFLISGFWHGAAWNFVAWGAYHGVFLCLDKLFSGTRLGRMPRWVAVPGTFVLVLIGWVFFRAPDLGYAVRFLGSMTGGASTVTGTLAGCFEMRHAVMLVLAAGICFGPAIKGDLLSWCDEPMVALDRPWRTGVQGVAALVMLVLSTVALATSHFNPFIYFRF